LALVELLRITPSKSATPRWLGARLGISTEEVNASLERLERLELISKATNGWSVNQETVISDQGIPNDAVRSFHRQILEKATQALAFQAGDERYGSSSLFPVRVKSVPRARKLIQDFRMNFAKEISDLEGGEEIYGLSLQFFKVSQNEEDSK
jgi:uncharacterized protein (TIGR02147 family)